MRKSSRRVPYSGRRHTILCTHLRVHNEKRLVYTRHTDIHKHTQTKYAVRAHGYSRAYDLRERRDVDVTSMSDRTSREKSITRIEHGLMTDSGNGKGQFIGEEKKKKKKKR